jgi:lipoprotein-anchoring transpeptidase ErfK/SrfK
VVVRRGATRYKPGIVKRRLLLGTLLSTAVLASLGVYLLADRLPSGRAAAPPPTAGIAPPTPAPAASAPARAVHAPLCTAGSVVPLDREPVAYAVTVRSRATAYRVPGGKAIARFDRLNANGVPTVLGVLGARLDRNCRANWYRVQLPLRPNGVTGWVPARVVTERALRVRIVVDLSDRRVTLYRGSDVLLVTAAAIGSPSTPTPTGRYYVNQKLVAPDPLGPFGPAALGISAFSPALRDWVQGGPIAIHGTNQAELLGSAVSHGCIRVANDVVRRLWKLVPTGTPVLIRM